MISSDRYNKPQDSASASVIVAILFLCICCFCFCLYLNLSFVGTLWYAYQGQKNKILQHKGEEIQQEKK